MRAYSLWVGPDPGWLMPCWELEDSTDSQRGEGHVLTEAETQGSHISKPRNAKDCSGERQEIHFSLSPRERTYCQHLGFGLLAS